MDLITDLLLEPKGRAFIATLLIPFLIVIPIILFKPDERGAWWTSVVVIWICLIVASLVWLGMGTHHLNWLYKLVDYAVLLGWAPACIWSYLLLMVRRLFSRQMRIEGGSV